jgi:hypothetical protein
VSNNHNGFAHLMALPAHCPGRIKTRDAVPFSDKTLARLCKPLSSPVMAFKPQTRGPWEKTPRYIDWLRSIGAAPMKPARKPRLPRKPKAAPMFIESAPEAWRDRPHDYANIGAQA